MWNNGVKGDMKIIEKEPSYSPWCEMKATIEIYIETLN